MRHFDLYDGKKVWLDKKGYATVWLDEKSKKVHVLEWEKLHRTFGGLSESAHRRERLKALGNGIVGQVAVEIMKAIKEADDPTTNPSATPGA